MAEFLLTAMSRHPQSKTMDGSAATWNLPPEPSVKANVDVSFKAATGEGVTAVIVKDSTGRMIAGATNRIIANLSLAAESVATRNAIILINNLGMEKTLIESDNRPMVQALKAGNRIAEIDPILKDILALKGEDDKIGFTWTERRKSGSS
ncbi:uncharacterized protein DS421_3g104770 [Arachis hypogaea]|nr:uncharacterized protein DS421_3g104770 [Arachis hypogaea]